MTSTPTPSIWSRLAHVADLVATPLEPSHYLELLNPLWSTHELRARVEAVRDEAGGARTLTLRPGRGWLKHRAGQHVRVSLPVGGRRMTRTFSIASSPERADGCIELTVKPVSGGRMTPFLTRNVLPGTHLVISKPAGDFVLPDDPPGRLLFVTAGSGITPVMSMLRTLISRSALPDIVHIHYAPRSSDLIFGDELRRIAAAHPPYRLQFIETRAGGSRASDAAFDQLCPDWRDRDAWACGPESMLEAVEGFMPRVHVERYHAKLPVSGNAVGGKVRFSKSGVESHADGRTSLLMVAENAGIAAPHGCRMGICHGCDATMVTGCVRDLRTGREISEPGTRVQVCISAALGDVELAL